MIDTEYRQPPEPTWAHYAEDRWDRLPTWARVFLAVFGALLVLAGFIGLTVWLFTHGWVFTGSIAACASVAAFVTMFAALVTEGCKL